MTEAALGGMYGALTKGIGAGSRSYVAAGELTYGGTYDAENKGVEH